MDWQTHLGICNSVSHLHYSPHHIFNTTHPPSGELEHERLRMKEELDEILGSRGEEREGAEIGEEEEEETFVHRGLRSQVAKQGEGGGTDHLDNCPGKKVTRRSFRVTVYAPFLLALVVGGKNNEHYSF